MTRTGVIALGIAQCVNWGVLYYAFAVLVLPLERELDVPAWVVTGAFSLALLASAALAPTVGRWGDRGRGALAMQAGGTAAAALLVTWTAWTFVSDVVMLYVVWAGLGLCMAMSLYEPAFAIVGRAYGTPARRLRALAAITLFGGLASTIFLPATAFLTDAFGWRHAVRLLAAALLLSAGLTRILLPRPLIPPAVSPSPSIPPSFADGDRRHAVRLPFIAITFAFATLASSAFAVNLFPLFEERGLPASTAAMVGGLMGVMQLPGRALLMRGTLAGSPARLLAVCLALHAAGLGAVALAPSLVLAAGGTMVFALGAGLMTVVRPHLVQTLVGGGQGGYLNGRIARYQQLARAAGPLAVAWTASFAGYEVVFATIGAGFLLAAAAWSDVSGRSPAGGARREAA
jgi:MFS family permease